jgi:hypothetical protein
VTTWKAGSGTLRILDLTLIQRPNLIQQNNSTYPIHLSCRPLPWDKSGGHRNSHSKMNSSTVKTLANGGAWIMYVVRLHQGGVAAWEGRSASLRVSPYGQPTRKMKLDVEERKNNKPCTKYCNVKKHEWNYSARLHPLHPEQRQGQPGQEAEEIQMKKNKIINSWV